MYIRIFQGRPNILRLEVSHKIFENAESVNKLMKKAANSGEKTAKYFNGLNKSQKNLRLIDG